MTVVERVRVHPGTLAGTVRVPGDKSLSHRALMLGALVGERVEVTGLAPSGDVAATAGALRTMGATVELALDAAGGLSGHVRGPLREPDDVLDCGNSGTSLRLLAGIAAGLDGVSVLTGDASLRRRPVDRIRRPLEAMGARIDARAGATVPPLVVRGGALRGIRYDSPVASAQVKSCVLLAGLAADGPTTVASPLRSRDHTERMLEHLGLPVASVTTEDGREEVTVTPGPLRAAPLAVTGDPSSGAFWMVAGALGDDAVSVTDLNANPTRFGVVATLLELGADVTLTQRGPRTGEPVADVRVAASELAGGVLAGVGVVDALDELPILALAGARSRDGLEVRDAAELRVKESDRIASLAAAFRALGMAFEERDDGYLVPGGQRPGPGTVDAAGDHRIAMTAAIAATVATGPVEITGFGAVSSSYPSFLDDLAALGGRVEVLASRT
ncbi:MAG: 3-phosphoshikimate 1-carboxyvinyltransferase [Actinobacteria bacterium]|nr:3-phosphoshikimate 1-carboxyvinyltransferase [Actinomycetota bacterium]